MDLVLIAIGVVLMLLGLIGSILPVLPGTPLCWLGLVCLYATNAVPTDYWMLGATLAITIVITVLDYVIPAQGTKRFGGSKYGIWGTNIGLVVGIVAPVPFGFLIGPFIGAFVGEMIYNAKDHRRALKAATGSFIGFLASSFIQFVFCIVLFGIFLKVMFDFRSQLF